MVELVTSDARLCATAQRSAARAALRLCRLNHALEQIALQLRSPLQCALANGPSVVRRLRVDS